MEAGRLPSTQGAQDGSIIEKDSVPCVSGTTIQKLLYKLTFANVRLTNNALCFENAQRAISEATTSLGLSFCIKKIGTGPSCCWWAE